MSPAVFGDSVYVAGEDYLMRLDHGKRTWRANTERHFSSGVGTDGEIAVVASERGDVFAYDAKNGKLRWQAKVSSTVLAAPTVRDGLVLVRSIDNAVYAFDNVDGGQRWVFQRSAPSLEVRSAASPLVAGGYVMLGMPGGKLIALNLSSGVLQWEGVVARPRGVTPLDRIADVAAPPVIEANVICAVAYQGSLACFDLAAAGKKLWSRPLSSFAGLDIDEGVVYVSDDQDSVYAFDKLNGKPRWEQKSLFLRRLSKPVVVGKHVVVGDKTGVLHYLNRNDGSFAANFNTSAGAITLAPRRQGYTLIVQTQEGAVYALEADDTGKQ